MPRTSTFESIGIDLSGCNNIQLALSQANLDYVVEQTPIYRRWENTEIENPNFVETVRQTDGHSYGIVSKSYGMVQNLEGFEFIDYIDAPIQFVKGGETNTGMIYVICKMDPVEILGDRFDPFILFRNSFNGRYGLSYAIAPLRVVCQNQMSIAFREANNTVMLKHSKNIVDKFHEAQQVIANTANYIQQLREKAERLAVKAVTQEDVVRIMDMLFPITESMNQRQREHLNMKKAAFIAAYNCDDNSNFRGSAWGIINAVSDFYTHEEPLRVTRSSIENKFISVTFDPKPLQRVYEMLQVAV